MLKLDDIVALARSGYKVDDIKELIKLSKEGENEPEGKPEDKNELEDEQNPEDKKDPTPAGTINEPEGKPEDKKDPEKIIDYKKRSEELEAKLQELQKANTKQNIADSEKSDSEAFAEVMKEFM